LSIVMAGSAATVAASNKIEIACMIGEITRIAQSIKAIRRLRG